MLQVQAKNQFPKKAEVVPVKETNALPNVRAVVLLMVQSLAALVSRLTTNSDYSP